MSKLRAAFDTERAWLRGCEDERGVLDRMAGYRHSLAAARSNGNEDAENLVEELIELAEDRLAALKADAIRAKERAAAPAPQPPRAPSPPPEPPRVSPPPEPPPPPRAAPVRVEDSEVYRQLQAELAASQEAQRRAKEDADAARRSARRANEERDTVVAAQRQPASVAKASAPTPQPPKAANIARLSPPPTLPNWPSSAPGAREPNPPSRAATVACGAAATVAKTASPRPEPAAKPPRLAPNPPASGASRIERAPANPSSQPPAFAAPAAAVAAAPAPALTGADLAAYRRGAGLTQVAAAQRLGVTQGTISKAEGNPRTVLGPALHEALRLAAG